MAEPVNLKINGDGTVATGTYNDVTLNGTGTVVGDITANSLKVNGAGKANGSIKVGVLTVNGTGTFDAPVQAGEMAVNGTADLHAGLGVGKLKVAGSLGVDGGVAAHDVDLRGDLRVGADLEAERFVGEGRFIINGLLNADTVDVRLHGRSSAREIGGRMVVTRAPEGISSIFSVFAERRLVADIIEADDVQLVSTTAKVVRGARVALGEGCEVDLVEYTERLDRLPGARIGEERKVDAAVRG